jgi:hypothetical protein
MHGCSFGGAILATSINEKHASEARPNEELACFLMLTSETIRCLLLVGAITLDLDPSGRLDVTGQTGNT